MQTKVSHITYLGYSTWRSKYQHFGIKPVDRLQHVYCLGRTGMGKSRLLGIMAMQDIANGCGVAILDPHGDVAEMIVNAIPVDRLNDLVYLNAASPTPLAFNPLAHAGAVETHLLASEIVAIFRKNWLDSWGVRLEYILRYCIITLLHVRGTTFLDIHPLLLNKPFRDRVLARVTDQAILAFWQQEYDGYTPSQRKEAISSILNKSGSFRANTAIKRILGQRSDSISMMDIVDMGKILIVNLSKGQIGEQACALLGSMITTSIQMAVMRKARLAESQRKPFYLYLDEAHSFMTVSFAQMLSECRKYKLGLFIAHQYLDQLTEDTKNAILGNVGTMIAFRLGTKDSRIMKEEMYPVFSVEDFINLSRFHFYIKLLIDGVACRAFSAVLDDP